MAPKNAGKMNENKAKQKNVLTEEVNRRSKRHTKQEIENQESKRQMKRKCSEKENKMHDCVKDVKKGNSAIGIETSAKKKKISKSKNPPAAEDRENNQNLPKGWKRVEVTRKSGKSAGRIDIYIYSPDGIKFRSRPDVAAYLSKTKSTLKLESFNFSAKKMPDETTIKVYDQEQHFPAVKQKNEKKKSPSTSNISPKKVTFVEINFSSKTRKCKIVKEVSDKQRKQAKSSDDKRKASGTSSKAIKKKKKA